METEVEFLFSSAFLLIGAFLAVSYLKGLNYFEIQSKTLFTWSGGPGLVG